MIRIGTTQDLADTLGLLRQLAGITQTAVAGELGCHPNRIGEYENHRRRVSVRVALNHLRALGYGLAIVPLDGKAPEVALSATQAAQEPSVGIPGGVGGAEAVSGAPEAFEVMADADGEHSWITLACDCLWNVDIDDPVSLRDLNQRAQEHAEVCR